MESTGKSDIDGSVAFTLFGANVDDGFVRVGDLSECMHQLRVCLKEVDRCVSGSRSSLQYVIRSMHVGSPAFCDLFAKKLKRKRDVRSIVSRVFIATVTSLASGDNMGLDERLDFPALKSFQKFAEVARPKDDREQRRLIVGGVEINRNYFAAIDDAVAVEESSYGSISGSLEKIDVHDRNQFTLFPRPVGSPGVQCFFSDSLISQITDALKNKNHVTIYGKKNYGRGRLNPLTVEVESIELHEHDGFPTFESFAGCLSHLKDDAVAIIRKIRDEWDE